MVRGTKSFAVALTLAGSGSLVSAVSSALAKAKASKPNGQVFRQSLDNDGDVSYTCTVSLGGQDIAVIPDTGSFELVVFSTKCDSCGDPRKLFNPSKSKSFTNGSLHAQQTYGSGATDSEESYDTIKVGPISNNKQAFWNVVDANIPILKDAKFQGIFGLGPPTGNTIIADEEAKGAQDEINEMKKEGQDVARYEPFVQQIQDVAEFAKKEELWASSIKMSSFSFCLGKKRGTPGVLVYNDDAPQSAFTKTVKVKGDTYWSADLQNVGFDSIPNKNGDGNGEPFILGCENGCSAFLDTGTSLLAAPAPIVQKLTDLLDNFLSDASNGCEDLSKLPDLKFKFGGEDFTLPPEAYIGDMSGDIPDWALNHMPHLARVKATQLEKKDSTKSWCVPLFMSTGNEDMWILGLPFFRQYYTMFTFSKDFQAADTMHFVEADDGCDLNGQKGHEKIRTSPVQRGMPLQIDAAKLHGPRPSRFHKLTEMPTALHKTTPELSHVCAEC